MHITYEKAIEKKMTKKIGMDVSIVHIFWLKIQYNNTSSIEFYFSVL